MAIYRLKDDRLYPFHPRQVRDGLYEEEIEDLVWRFPEEVVGEPLFLVGRQQVVEGGSRPDIIALDDDARVVVVEVKREFDRRQLAQALEYAGWAQTTSLDEVAGVYQHQYGEDSDFFEAWREWGASKIPRILNPYPRMVVVARDFHERTRAALDFMQTAGMSVEVRTVTIHADRDDTIIEVGGVDVPSPQTLPTARPTQGDAERRYRHFGISLQDLVGAGLVVPGERLRFARPRLGRVYWGNITNDGIGIELDGQEFSSPSAAAMAAAQVGSYDGWYAWAVERDGDWVKLVELRARLLQVEDGTEEVATDNKESTDTNDIYSLVDRNGSVRSTWDTDRRSAIRLGSAIAHDGDRLLDAQHQIVGTYTVRGSYGGSTVTDVEVLFDGVLIRAGGEVLPESS